MKVEKCPFQVTSPTVNASELYAKDRVRYEEHLRKQRIKKICQSIALGVFVAFLIIAFGLGRRFRSRWPFVTLMLYAIFFVLIILPMLWGLFVCVGQPNVDFGDLTEFPGMYQWLYGDGSAWPFWLVFAGMILTQGCLLIIPVRTTHERPKPRRGIWLTAIAAAFLYTVLLFGIIVSLFSAISGDHWLEWANWILLASLPVNWLVWVVIFRMFARKADPQNYVRRLVKWLMRGSILELLIAVPSHIIVRHKDVCCAHMATAAGIAAGLAVMFFAYGPGIYYLYQERIQSKKLDLAPKDPESEP